MGHLGGEARLAHQQRKYWRVRVADLETRGLELLAQMRGIVPQAANSFRLRRNDLDPRRGRCGDRWWKSGRVDEAARPIDQKIDHHLRAGDVSAVRSDCLAQRSHLNVDRVLQTYLRGQPRTTWSDNANRMRLVDHNRGFEFTREGDDLPQRREIAIHAENRVRNY